VYRSTRKSHCCFPPRLNVMHAEIHIIVSRAASTCSCARPALSQQHLRSGSLCAPVGHSLASSRDESSKPTLSQCPRPFTAGSTYCELKSIELHSHPFSLAQITRGIFVRMNADIHSDSMLPSERIRSLCDMTPAREMLTPTLPDSAFLFLRRRLSTIRQFDIWLL
jgi:hypothetical protein